MIKLFLYISITILTFISCSTQKVSVTKSQKSLVSDTLNYSTYWTAMRCGFPELANKFTTEPDKLEFAKGLINILENNFSISETIFKKIIESTRNDTVRDNSKILLEQVFIYQSKWKDYFEFFRNKNKADSTEIRRLLYPAFVNNSERINYSKLIDTIPICVKNGLIFIPVNVNGRDYNFLFDSGSQLTLLSTDVSSETGINSLFKHPASLIASTGKLSDVETGIIKSFKVGNYESNNKPCLISESANLKFKFWFYTFLSFDGVIGWDVIKNLDILIDCKNKKMIISKPQLRNVTEKNLFWLNHPIVRLKSTSGIELLFFFDSGAQNSKFYDFLLVKLKPEDLKDDKELIYGIGGSYTRNLKKIPNISFLLKSNKLDLENLVSGYEPEDQFIKLDGVLGNDIGLEDKIHIDAINGVFEIIKD